MGWHGDYEHPNDVIEEKIRYGRSNGIEILEKKSTKKWGAILYKADGVPHIDYFIFRDEMYKPLNWIEGPNLIPAKWINMVLPYEDDYTQKRYEEYKEEQRRKKAAPKLDDILIRGNKYLIWDKYEVIYSHKLARSHIFKLPDGDYTRFTKLSVKDVVEIN